MSAMSVYAKLCQSMTNLARRTKHTSAHTAKDGTHGGVCNSTCVGLGSATHIVQNICIVCINTRITSANTRGRYRWVHDGGGGMRRRWMRGCAVTSGRGSLPTYAITSTCAPNWSASESEWYCIRGDRP